MLCGFVTLCELKSLIQRPRFINRLFVLKFDIIYPSLQIYRRFDFCSNFVVLWYLKIINVVLFSGFDDSAKPVKI